MYKLADLMTIAILLVVGIITLVIGGDVTQEIRDDQTAGTAARNISDDGLDSFQEIGGWLPTVGTVVAASLIIGILVSSFAMGR